jgi:formylglycine-generating enzyme required for sulfatase activity
LTHDFEIQQTEVTVGSWRATGWADTSIGSDAVPPCTDDNCPANNTTWYQALQYANWLSEREALEPCFRVYDCAQRLDNPAFGLACETELLAATVYECEGYRLPTSAEWEYATRAGTTTAFYSGPITSFENNYACQLDSNLVPIAWYCANTPDLRAQPVAQLAPNPWGVFDLLGNVQEWTGDRSRGVQVPDPSIDPQAAWDAAGGAVLRSCGVGSHHTMCRSASGLESPRDARYAGIRLVRTLGKGTLPTLDDILEDDSGAAPAQSAPE